MKRELYIMGLFLVGCALIVSGLSALAEPEHGDYGQAQPVVDLAKDDLVQRFGVAGDDIVVQDVEAVQFPDSSLGVPEAGKMYLMVVTPGYVVKLVVGGKVYEYHGTASRVVLAP